MEEQVGESTDRCQGCTLIEQVARDQEAYQSLIWKPMDVNPESSQANVGPFSLASMVTNRCKRCRPRFMGSPPDCLRFLKLKSRALHEGKQVRQFENLGISDSPEQCYSQDPHVETPLPAPDLSDIIEFDILTSLDSSVHQPFETSSIIAITSDMNVPFSIIIVPYFLLQANDMLPLARS